jgi:hypothetical protein
MKRNKAIKLMLKIAGEVEGCVTSFRTGDDDDNIHL